MVAINRPVFAVADYFGGAFYCAALGFKVSMVTTTDRRVARRFVRRARRAGFRSVRFVRAFDVVGMISDRGL
jgi:hypothetical protein